MRETTEKLELPHAWVAEVLSFWFGELGPEQWFESMPEQDASIRARFHSLYDRLAASLPAEAWRDGPSALAAVIVLDQFPRNMFRGDARAFGTDATACAITRNALDLKLDVSLPPEQKKFLYMPLMHSEALADQERCVQLFQTLDDPEALRFAQEHRDIIARFGRFPHRNGVLGRESSQAERQFLAEHAGYGQ